MVKTARKLVNVVVMVAVTLSLVIAPASPVIVDCDVNAGALVVILEWTVERNVSASMMLVATMLMELVTVQQVGFFFNIVFAL